MSRAKYIVGVVLDNPDNRRLETILFSDTLTHKQAADLFGYGEHVVSAGFYDFCLETERDTERQTTKLSADVHVFGESETLGIGGQDFDLYYVKRALGLTDHDESRRMADYNTALKLLKERGIASNISKLEQYRRD